MWGYIHQMVEILKEAPTKVYHLTIHQTSYITSYSMVVKSINISLWCFQNGIQDTVKLMFTFTSILSSRRCKEVTLIIWVIYILFAYKSWEPADQLCIAVFRHNIHYGKSPENMAWLDIIFTGSGTWERKCGISCFKLDWKLVSQLIANCLFIDNLIKSFHGSLYFCWMVWSLYIHGMTYQFLTGHC